MRLRLGFLVLLCGAATAFMGVQVIESVDAAQLFNSQTQSSEKDEAPTLYNKQKGTSSKDSPTLYNKQDGYVPSQKGKSGLVMKKKHAGEEDGSTDYDTASLFQTIVKRTPVTSQLEHLLSPAALQSKKTDVALAINNEFKINVETAKKQQKAYQDAMELRTAALEKDRLAREAYFAEMEQDKIERREKRLKRLNMVDENISNVVKRKKKTEKKRQSGTPVFNRPD